MKRFEDWMKQAEADLEAAKDSLKTGHYEWACFQSQQAVEKMIKAFFDYNNISIRGHSIRSLMKECENYLSIPSHLVKLGIELDFHYLQPRYPNGFITGYPAQYYTEQKAEEIINIAEQIIEYFKTQIIETSRNE